MSCHCLLSSAGGTTRQFVYQALSLVSSISLVSEDRHQQFDWRLGEFNGSSLDNRIQGRLRDTKNEILNEARGVSAVSRHFSARLVDFASIAMSSICSEGRLTNTTSRALAG